MQQRIAIARLWHEGNSFTPVRTRLRDFHAREWAEGAEVPALYGGTRTELGAAVDFFRGNRGNRAQHRGEQLRMSGRQDEGDRAGVCCGAFRPSSPRSPSQGAY